MSSKEQLLNFLNAMFAIILIAASIFYFTIPGNYERFQEIIKALTPVIVFAAVLIVRLKLISRSLVKAQSENGSGEIIIHLTHWDKAKYDIILIGLPIILILITFFSEGPNFFDTVQATIVFVVNLFLLKSIFSKRE